MGKLAAAEEGAAPQAINVTNQALLFLIVGVPVSTAIIVDSAEAGEEHESPHGILRYFGKLA